MQVPEFLKQSPPPGYIAGVGRGAVGFSTRGTNGPTRVPARLNERENLVNMVSSEGKEDPRFKDTNEDNRDNPSIVNEDYEFVDEEADDIFAEVDQRLASRRKNRSGTKPSNQERTPFSQSFSELKRNLAQLSEQDWLRVPEAGDITKANKRSRLKEQLERKTYSAPDTLFTSNVNLTRLTEEREKFLALQLDSSFKTSSTDRSIAAYIQDLDSSNTCSNASNFDDEKKTRRILELYRKSNPRDAQAWIDSARLEERLNKLTRSKNLIDEGCKLCPRDENIWLENIRLNSSDSAYCKVLIVDAIRFNEKSERIWLKGIDLEQGEINRKKMIRRSLQHLPRSEKLWKLAIKHENDKNEVIKILKKAIELLPNTLEFWTLLITLQEPSDARRTLEDAKKIYHGEKLVWILSCQVDEADGRLQYESLCETISKGISEMQEQGTEYTLVDWIQEAIRVEKLRKYNETVKAIVSTTMNMYFDENSMDGEELLSFASTSPLTTRCIYSSILSKFPGKYSLWKSFVKICQENNDIKTLHDTWEMCIFKNEATIKKYPLLVLMYTKFVWGWGKNHQESIEILNRALLIYPEYTAFRLAKLKILINAKSDESDIKRSFEETFEYCGDITNEVTEYYIKYLLSRMKYEEAKIYLDNALKTQPKNSLYYILQSEVCLAQTDLKTCQTILSKGIQQFPNSIKIFIEAAKVELLLGDYERARSILNIGIVNNKMSDQLYQARATLEADASNHTQARHFISQGLKACPDSWRLWSENIKLLPKKSLRKTMFHDALTKTKEHPMVMLAIGKVFAYEYQFERAKMWFQRAIQENNLFADCWAWLYFCEQQLNPKSSFLENIIQNFIEHEPRFGPLWERFTSSPNNFMDSPDKILQLVVSHIKLSMKDGMKI